MEKRGRGRPAGQRMQITGKEQEFARAYVRTQNKSAAYRAAYTVSPLMQSTRVATAAGKVFNRPMVRAEIDRLLAAEQQARADAYKAQTAEELERWSRDDSIDHLKQVILAAQEAMRVPVKSDDGDVVGYDFDPAAARVIRDTVETLNKMQGYNEPEKSEVDARVSVEFADGDDLAV